jgi:hypothetical protein
MWGAWFIVTFGLTVGLVLLLGALALSAWSPIFAVFAFIIIAVIVAAGAAMRRSTQYVDESEGDSRRRPEEADVIGAGAPDRGAPAQGEGGSHGAETIPPPTRP